jgi:hypothetical protein
MNEYLIKAYQIVYRDDFVIEYPGEYIGKCIEAFERFDLPEEIYQRGQHFFDIYERIQKLFDKD